MKYYRPYCKVVTGYTTGTIAINFEDSANNLLNCNYINVGIAGATSQPDICLLELVGTSGVQSFLYNYSSAITSGGFVMPFTSFQPVEILLPPDVTANAVRINRFTGSVGRTIYVNYGVVQEESPFKSAGKYKGV